MKIIEFNAKYSKHLTYRHALSSVECKLGRSEYVFEAWERMTFGGISRYQVASLIAEDASRRALLMSPP